MEEVIIDDDEEEQIPPKEKEEDMEFGDEMLVYADDNIPIILVYESGKKYICCKGGYASACFCLFSKYFLDHDSRIIDHNAMEQLLVMIKYEKAHLIMKKFDDSLFQDYQDRLGIFLFFKNLHFLWYGSLFFTLKKKEHCN